MFQCSSWISFIRSLQPSVPRLRPLRWQMARKFQSKSYSLYDVKAVFLLTVTAFVFPTHTMVDLVLDLQSDLQRKRRTVYSVNGTGNCKDYVTGSQNWQLTNNSVKNSEEQANCRIPDVSRLLSLRPFRLLMVYLWWNILENRVLGSSFTCTRRGIPPPPCSRPHIF